MRDPLASIFLPALLPRDVAVSPFDLTVVLNGSCGSALRHWRTRRELSMRHFLKWRAHSITEHLFLFALGLTLPTLLLSGFIGWAYLRQEGQRIDRLADQQVQSVVAQIDNRLATLQATLNVLTTNAMLLEGDMDGFRSRLEQTNLPADVWLTVRDRNGQQLLNTSTSRETPLPAFAGPGGPGDLH